MRVSGSTGPPVIRPPASGVVVRIRAGLAPTRTWWRDLPACRRTYRMHDDLTVDAGRLEQILGSVDHFKPVATRRSFMQKMLVTGGAAAAAAAGATRVMNVFASSGVGDFVNAAVGAERIGIA